MISNVLNNETDRAKYFVEKYKQLFIFGNNDDIPYYMVSVPEEWFNIIDELLMYLSKIDNGNIQIVQIKEKFRTLRVYYNNGNDNVKKLITNAEQKCLEIISKNCHGDKFYRLKM